jgi:uncharacterized protein YjbI with pentapeptide repeats
MSDKEGTSSVVALDAKGIPPIPDIGRLSVSHQKVVGASWRGRLFRDFNARSTEFEDCDFRNSIFERAYFRDSKFTNCRFDGARFSECNIKTAKFYGCTMSYVLFRRCQVDLEELVAALPPEPNLRREALQNLRANAVEIGDYGSQTHLILQELKSAKLHYSYNWLRVFEGG